MIGGHGALEFYELSGIRSQDPSFRYAPTPQYSPVTPCRYLDTNQVPDNCTQDDVVTGVSAKACYVRGMTQSAPRGCVTRSERSCRSRRGSADP